MATEVNYSVGNRKYLGGNFSPAGCHTLLLISSKIRTLCSKGELLLLGLNIIHGEKLFQLDYRAIMFFIVKAVSLNSFTLAFLYSF